MLQQVLASKVQPIPRLEFRFQFLLFKVMD
jgi:hypothetical protein